MPAKGPSEAIFFAQIAVLVLAGRLLGEAMQRIGQPTVMGHLIAGLLLGPSVFGLLAPAAQQTLFPPDVAQKGMIEAMAQFGILLLLLLTGMETDLKLVRRVGAASIAVSIAGIVLPFTFGFGLGQLLPQELLPNPDQRLITSLFLGTALSISSVKIVAVVIREMNFMRRNLGQVILAAAIIDDTVGWIIIAITFSLAIHGAVDLAALAQSLVGTALFLVLSLTLGRSLVALLIRWVNDSFISEVPVISLTVVIMIAMALTTHAIGVHSVLGAFVAGILIGESPILTRQIDRQLRGLITGLFSPIFFAMAGMSSDLTILGEPGILALTAGLILVATLGKASGAFVGGQFSGLTRRESVALACGMNARGSTEIIVATIGLSSGLLGHELFTMIVTMAVVTTLAMPPMLRWSLARLPMRREEAERLAREEADADGFVARIERILVAVDGGGSGRMAARIAGLLAGPRGAPATLLHAAARHPAAELEAAARAAVESAATSEDKAPDRIDVVVKKQEALTREAIAAEAEKGYDLLVVGIGPARMATAGFSREVGRIAAGFAGPLAIAVARSAAPAEGLNILVPFTGTGVSQRAAELAMAVARGVRGSVTALHIVERDREMPVTRAARRAVLDRFKALSQRYETPAQVKISTGRAADEAILSEAKDFDLIVLGVNRRAGDVLYFGDVAAAVLEKAEASLVFVTDATAPAAGD